MDLEATVLTAIAVGAVLLIGELSSAPASHWLTHMSSSDQVCATVAQGASCPSATTPSRWARRRPKIVEHLAQE